MSTQILLENFEKIYQETYERTLKYIICKCNNFDDINDIIQDTYVELYKNLKKKKILKVEKIEDYIIGISKNIMKKYYKNKRQKAINFVFETDENKEIKDIFDLEEQIITKDNVEKVWNYVKTKNILITKTFYLYYCLDMKISDISKELNVKESNIKNYLYRTLKEIKEKGGI